MHVTTWIVYQLAASRQTKSILISYNSMNRLRVLAQFLASTTIVVSLFLSTFTQISAVTSIPAGIHILNIEEVAEAAELTQVAGVEDVWTYVTVPFTLGDLEKQSEWQRFFDTAASKKMIPLVRLTTAFEEAAWKVPTKKNIVDQISFLSKLNWPTDEKHIIVFNEVNHSKEWGGQVNPEEYAHLFAFTANWAHTEAQNFVVLPAALDLAAPNGRSTMEAFNFLSKMKESDSDVFLLADAWNSHSYPNPGFSASPQRQGQNSLSGFKSELAWLQEHTGKAFSVYITETGWDVSGSLDRWMASYYQYAVSHVWSDPAVVAVTPFILQGSPGPFSGFSFLDGQGEPTTQYVAYKKALKNHYAPSDLLLAKIEVIE